MGELKLKKENQCSNLHLEVLKEPSRSLPIIRRVSNFLDLKKVTPVVETVETINFLVCPSSYQQVAKAEPTNLMNQTLTATVTATRIQINLIWKSLVIFSQIR